VLQLTPHLAVQLFVGRHVLLEDRRHRPAQLVILPEHLVDVRRVQQHLDHLIEQEIEGIFARLDALLLGRRPLEPRQLGAGQPLPLLPLARQIGGLLLGPHVVIKHRGHIQLDLLDRLGLDLARGDQRLDRLGRDGPNLAAVKTHAGVP